MINLEDQAKKRMKSLLLVDDDRLILSTLSSGLSRAGYMVSTAESVDEAEVWLDNNDKPDLVILDVRMSGRNGLELAEQLSRHHHVPFIMLTAHSEQDVIAHANISGAMGYLVKPIDITQLIPAIETAISRAQELYGLRGAKQQLQTALDADRSVSIAVGILMDQHRLGQKDAMNLLRDSARSRQIKLAELASLIINSRETLNVRNSA
ncbi:putative transcriptional regulatory protein pdtaR [Methylophilaceae bacterium]|nr:putative transcriptional regulatory protein pdtaR [Methylophilaceae bacterium]